MTTSSISHTVMRRVRVAHTLRPFVSGTALAVFFLLLAVWGIGREVWVAHVFTNLEAMPSLASAVHFVVSAFVSTRFVVQALSVLALGAFVWIVRDTARNLVPSFSFA